MDFSLKKSFKSHGSYNKHTKKISAGGGSQTSHEQLPILSDQDIVEDRHPHISNQIMNDDSTDRSEVIVKVDEGGDSMAAGDPSKNAGKYWRETSYDVWKDPSGDNVNDSSGEGGDGKRKSFNFVPGSKQQQQQGMEDPPSKLIGQFLHKQRASGDIALDMDLEMEELRNSHDRDLPPLAESPMNVWQSRELRVSFNPPLTSADASDASQITESMRRRYKESPGDEESQGQQGQPNHDEEEVVRCTSNASFQREISFQSGSSLLRVRTKSRLMDPPDDPDRRADRVPRSGQIPKSGQVQKSGQMKSGFLGKTMEEEEDDPFLDEDLPDDFTRSNLSALTLIQWASLVLNIGALACTLSVPYLRNKNLWKLKLWKWEVLIAVLICGRLVSGWGIRILVFFIERNFVLRKRVLYFVYGIRKAVQNCLWLGLVLIAWHFLFDKKVERETRSEGLKYVTKVLVCFLVGTLLWLVKTLIVKVLASSFHVSTYFDRIQDSLFNQFVIETLSGPPLIEIHKTEEEDERLADEVQKLQNAGVTIPPDLKAAALSSGLTPPRASRVIGSGRLSKTKNSAKLSRVLSKTPEGITIDHLHKLNPKNVSAWNMKRLMKMVRNGSLTTLDEQILDTTHDDDSGKHIRSEVEAKAAAKKIFHNVARRGSKFIYLEDLMRFMREDEAHKTMSLFEGAAETQRISKSSLKNWVVNAFRERRALALTLNDTKTAVNKLHHMVNIIVAIVIGVIWLLVLGIATSKFLLFVSSQLVLVAFVFGNTCKTVFEAIVFLFVMHPFDVGDRCEIDGVQMVVEEMNILTTVFLRYDNTKIIFPNSTLATKAINNFYRSPDTGDGIEFCIHVATPADKIAAVKQRITNYVESKVEHWYPAPMIIMKDLEELNRVKMAVWLCHKMNHQDMGERYSRRSLLIEEMVKTFRELDIQYRLLPMDINICTMPTVTSTRLPNNWTATTS
ncbi:mechanosensitive ion channel protein 6-like [Humulus lupulus]|uniref:mechanosensitive ion channel protein 6-like n=1 Tax=Humulus lupulus TaxID=3486 RepID=UPI002B410D19|nr:mechanosensitive ion channel protein 6-like [Humulus lupulus]XP_062086896.1 mechanosensitive ion channel protein 6-like [Humulus lupulus]